MKYQYQKDIVIMTLGALLFVISIFIIAAVSSSHNQNGFKDCLEKSGKVVQTGPIYYICVDGEGRVIGNF